MANIKITDLTAYTDPLNTDVLPIVDVTQDTTKKVSIASLLKNASSGTAAAPGIAFDGGSSTGFWYAATDTLAVSTAGTEWMRISQNGNVRMGATFDVFSVSPTLLVADAYAAGVSAQQIHMFGTFGTTDSNFLICTNDGGQDLYIRSNGDVLNTNNSYGSISDVKLKENIVAANSQWNDLKALQVRNFNFKKNPTHTHIGLVAQEVELISPGLVSESPDRDEDGNDLGTTTKSVRYSVLYMKAIKALQEAMERIEQLETKVAALEGQ